MHSTIFILEFFLIGISPQMGNKMLPTGTATTNWATFIRHKQQPNLMLEFKF